MVCYFSYQFTNFFDGIHVRRSFLLRPRN
jgi:hypothetical protein